MAELVEDQMLEDEIVQDEMVEDEVDIKWVELSQMHCVVKLHCVFYDIVHTSLL